MIMNEIKRIDAISAGKILGALMAIIGFCIGLVISVMSVLFGAIAPTILSQMSQFSALSGQSIPSMEMMPMIGLMGMLAMVAFPILYGILGFIYGAAGAAAYNFIAARTGGLKIELG